MTHKNLMLLLLAGTLLAGCSSTVDQNKEIQTEAQDKQTLTQENQNDKNNTDNADGAGTDTSVDSTSEETKDDDIDIDGVEVKSNSIVLDDYDQPVKITSAGTYNISGSGKTIVVDAKKQDVTLVLDNVTLNNDSMPALFVKKAASVTVELKGKNSMTTGSAPAYEPLDAALYSKADLIMQGDGSLTINSGYEHGIKAKDTAVFKNGTYDITAKNDGIHVNETAEFQNGNYTITCDGEGIEAKDSMIIWDGTYTIHSRDDGINAINSLTVNGGTLSVISASNDALDSNGDLILNGGDITAIGAKTPETSFDTDNTPLEFNGGKILGIGAVGVIPTKADQPVLQIGTNEVITSVELKAEDGTSVVKWEVPSYTGQGTALILSDSSMKKGSTYEIFINGTSYDTVTLSESEMTTTVGNVQTMGGGFKGQGGGRPGGMNGQRPEDFDGQMPEDFNGERPERPEDFNGERPNPGQRPFRGKMQDDSVVPQDESTTDSNPSA